MASKVSIANAALSFVGVGDHIAALDEQSEEAEACNQFYPDTRDELLTEFEYGFARAYAKLALVVENPTPEWAYGYRWPSDCVKPRRILTGLGPDVRPPFETGQDAQGRLIYTNEENAELEYTFRADDPSRYPQRFSTAFARLLASKIAPRISGGDPFRLGEFNFQMYMKEIGMAQAEDARSEEPRTPPDSPSITARG